MRQHEEFELHEEKSGIASPDGAISFLLCIFAIVNGYSNIVNLALASQFSIGAVQALLSIGAFTAALINILRGKARGNINMLATLLLGLFPGLTKLIRVLSYNTGFAFDDYLFGVVYLIGALFCLMVAIKRMYKPAYRFLGTLCLAIGFFLNGIGLLNHMHWLVSLSGWLYFVFAAEMYYFGMTVMYFYYDARLPQGPALFHRRHHE